MTDDIDSTPDPIPEGEDEGDSPVPPEDETEPEAAWGGGVAVNELREVELERGTGKGADKPWTFIPGRQGIPEQPVPAGPGEVRTPVERTEVVDRSLPSRYPETP